ncbi:hypothetical protein N7468_008863 [Penicillium chermesinum]|uniref:Uncharacterized protein n=1 Tax=Penicillium chermesinum TaxID=63820 RepID=A0A9W9NGQ8_9EURO|nr:uncharacterized protein N7468_008863 [Penicillium chermesinum]KAJ5219659.1 hypothetical protein N7468_008863 [Penicillium chermesinum]
MAKKMQANHEAPEREGGPETRMSLGWLLVYLPPARMSQSHRAGMRLKLPDHAAPGRSAARISDKPGAPGSDLILERTQ